MSADPRGHESHADKNDGQEGLATAGPATGNGPAKLEAAPPGADHAGNRPPVSSGLISLCVVAGQHQRSADPMQLARALGLDPLAEPTETQLLLAAKELGLKAKVVHSSWARLPNNTLPAIVQLKAGGYVVLLRIDPEGHVLIGDPRQRRPQRLAREPFEALWSGKLLLVRTRLRFDNPQRPFDLTWFVPAIWKYRKILGEILA